VSYTLNLDIETFSTVPIKHGTHRYAEEAEVLLVQTAIDDGPVHVEDTSGPGEWEAYAPKLQALIDGAEAVVTHNSTFERTLLRHCGVSLPVEKIDDTMVVAFQHSLPGALGMLCDVLGVPQDKAKDKAGKKLIHLFTKPRPKNSKLRRATRETHPNEWQQFIEYARLDVVAMRDVRKRLPRWNCVPSERALWLLDQAVNDRGFAVDLDLAKSAIRAFDRVAGNLATAASALTNGAVGSATQRDRLKDFIATECGLELENLQKGTLERLLRGDDVDPRVRALLENRLEAAATSPSKYTALTNAASSDGRLRGAIQFCGASRTFRDAGRIFQPQNLPRPSMSCGAIEVGIAAMKADCEDLIYDVSELCVSAIRGCLVPATGKKFVISDLSNIEGRVLAWIANEEWKLKAFKDYDAGIGHDLYKITAGRILGKSPENVTKADRQNPGKISELACGFQGAVGAFRKMGGAAVEAMSDEDIAGIVKAWRAANPRIKALWYDVDAAMRRAINSPGEEFIVRDLLHFATHTDHMGTLWLRVKCPGGLYLSYREPEIAPPATCERCGGEGEVDFEFEDKVHRLTCPECNGAGATGGGEMSYTGVDSYTKQWKRLKTYGGHCVENITQHVARMVFFSGFKRAEAAGYHVVLRVHDELVCEVPDTPEYSEKALSAMLATNPGWGAGLPLAAAGHECYRYAKED
jgi:DNA polymerase